MSEINTLERECKTLCSYLIGRNPETYVVEKYAEAHRKSPAYSDIDRFGEFLVRVARTHPLLAKMADSYARLFVPFTLLRKKLVLLLAILETCAPSYQMLDEVDSNSRLLLLLQLAMRGSGSILSLFVASLLFSPVRLVLALQRVRD